MSRSDVIFNGDGRWFAVYVLQILRKDRIEARLVPLRPLTLSNTVASRHLNIFKDASPPLRQENIGDWWHETPPSDKHGTLLRLQLDYFLPAIIFQSVKVYTNTRVKTWYLREKGCFVNLQKKKNSWVKTLMKTQLLFKAQKYIQIHEWRVDI